MTEILVAPMTAGYAADILSWRYPAPYDYYNVVDGDAGYYLDPANRVFAVLTGDRLIGFRSFGPDGRVPGGAYDDSALDTGGGLRPELTGRGLGRSVIEAGLEFGRQRFAPPAFRVTVASFNTRALRVVTSLGFQPASSFAATTDGRRFEILTRGCLGDLPFACRSSPLAYRSSPSSALALSCSTAASSASVKPSSATARTAVSGSSTG
jgi:ribosomal-protein-alanine N-acetyltransferase